MQQSEQAKMPYITSNEVHVSMTKNKSLLIDIYSEAYRSLWPTHTYWCGPLVYNSYQHGATIRAGLTSESHYLQPMLGTHRSLVAHTGKCGWAIRRAFLIKRGTPPAAKEHQIGPRALGCAC